jgi:hypothetical protein
MVDIVTVRGTELSSNPIGVGCRGRATLEVDASGAACLVVGP